MPLLAVSPVSIPFRRAMIGRRPAVFAALRTCLVAAVFSTGLPAYAADVTALRVKFASTAADGPDAASFQLLAAAVQTGIASTALAADGSLEIRLASAMSFEQAQRTLNQLRMHPSLLYASIAATGAASRAPSAAQLDRAGAPLLSRIIVKYRNRGTANDAVRGAALSQTSLDELAQQAGRALAYERSLAWAGAHLLSLMVRSPRADVEVIARALAAHPDVEWAQPDYLRHITVLPDDPLYPDQWHYLPAASEVASSNLPAAWDRTRGWSGLRVAVLDTGALLAHPDFASRWLGGYDFVNDYILANDADPSQPGGCATPGMPPCIGSRDANPADPGDWVTAADSNGATFGGWLTGCPVTTSSWHGSHVAGTIGARTGNATGVAGVNWVSRIVPVRVLGKCGGYDSDIADAMTWASGGSVSGVPVNLYPARVLNLSLGAYTEEACPALYQTAIDGALGRGSVVVVSAGNDSADASDATPANCNGVITVAALARDGRRASYSNYDNNDGSGVAVEIAAPGGVTPNGVLSAINTGVDVPLAGGHSYGRKSGTSMAAPHVAGIVSLMLSLKPALTPAQVLALLQSTARPFLAFPLGDLGCTSNLAAVNVTTKYCGAGMVDGAAVLASIMATGGPGGTPLTLANATLASSANPASLGANITLTATVTGASPGGSVAFVENEASLAGCAAVPLTGAGNTRTAQCVMAAAVLGDHVIVARYSGDAANTPADAPPLDQLVAPAAPVSTTTVLSSEPQPSAQGEPATLVASVSGFRPDGPVAFTANGATLAGCAAVPLAGTGDTRSASCSTSALSSGGNTITASYAGNASNQPSNATAVHYVYAAGACGVFNDMAEADAFCPNVQWLYNRAVTLGCTPVTYCPESSVSRAAMAAFMNRLAVNALTPADWYGLQTSSSSLASPTVVCAIGPFSIGEAPARVSARVTLNAYGPSSGMQIAGEPVWSTNGGTTWNAMPSGPNTLTVHASRSPADDRTITFTGSADLAALASNVYFGVRVSRVAGSGSTNLYCVNRVQIGGRNPATPPY